MFGKHGGGLEDGSLFRVRLNAEEDYFLRHYNVNLERINDRIFNRLEIIFSLVFV